VIPWLTAVLLGVLAILIVGAAARARGRRQMFRQLAARYDALEREPGNSQPPTAILSTAPDASEWRG
jgi:hypothetical protein